MFKTRHYVPILKWKRGEQGALAELDTELKNKLTPLVEIQPIPIDFRTEEYARTIDQHLEDVIERLKISWDITRPIFLDLYWIEPDERMKNDEHPLSFLADDSRRNDIKIIPVTGLDRDSDYQSEVKNINKQDKNGICLRIDSDYIGNPNIEKQLTSIMQLLENNPEGTDLILDLGYVTSDQEKILTNLLIIAINNFPHVNDWRTFTLTATAFPQDLSRIPPKSITPIRRSGWFIWNNLINSEIKRKPAFGDYAIAHPELVEIDPRIMTMSANIRYTIESEWLILKGHSVKKEPGFKQFHDLSNLLINRSEYSGRDFSFGDLYIGKCAQREVGSGNATTWRKVGTNHHLAFVIDQITNLAISDET